jgi:hypothetical protein
MSSVRVPVLEAVQALAEAKVNVARVVGLPSDALAFAGADPEYITSDPPPRRSATADECAVDV